MADNFHFDMTGVPLEKALDIAFGQYSKAVGYRVENDPCRLILYWVARANGDDVIPFPAPMDAEASVMFVKAWLKHTAKYGSQPDHDGDNKRGCRVYNETWGNVGRDYRAFVAIEPVWLMYGK